MKIVLLGAPGSGKGTQAETLAPRLGVPHVSTGELFRHNVDSSTPLGVRARDYVQSGNLVPAALTNMMMAERLREPDAAKGFILDGYPRSIEQANFLESVFAEDGTAVERVLEFRVAEEELVERLLNRGRKDDTEAVIRHRLTVYRDETAPLLSYYEDRLSVIEATGSVEDVSAKAFAALQN